MLLSVACAVFGESPLRYGLPDAAGGVHEATATAGKVTVYVMLSAECPISMRYLPVLERLAKKHPEIMFLGVAPGKSKGPVTSFPVLVDEQFHLSRQLHAEMTPEVFVFDRTGALRYRGRIDDRYLDFGKRREQVTQDDLQLAIDDLLAGRPVKVSRRRGVGCWIEYGAR